MTQKPITIEYAREKLGKRGKKMTDQQISDLLITLRLLCDKAIDIAIQKNNHIDEN